MKRKSDTETNGYAVFEQVRDASADNRVTNIVFYGAVISGLLTACAWVWVIGARLGG